MVECLNLRNEEGLSIALVVERHTNQAQIDGEMLPSGFEE